MFWAQMIARGLLLYAAWQWATVLHSKDPRRRAAAGFLGLVSLGGMAVIAVQIP